MRRPETGRLLGEFPYVRVGDDPRPLVVLPGVGDAIFDGEYPPVAGWVLCTYFARYLGDHTVYVVSRPRGLPEGYTAGDGGADHARLLDEVLGPADVLGVSIGGMIALELARRRPDLVERLVLANSGARLAPECRDDVRSMRRRVRDYDWAAIRAELAGGMFSDWRRVAYPFVIRTLGRVASPEPAVPSDVRVSFDLALAYDGSPGLDDVERPTLVFGGTRDPYFTESVQRETAAGLPDATLSLVPGARHGAFHERKLTFDGRVTRFLDGSR